MKFLRNNIWTLTALLFLFCVVAVEPASAAGSVTTNTSVFGTAKAKLSDLFKNAKTVLFVIGGFGLIALAFQAIFGKVKWPWFAALAFGLAVVAAAGSIVNYATDDKQVSAKTDYSDSLLGVDNYK
ncbi:MAG: TrbC/VirB2 family protein [Alphaproteobacteria bacterium]|nr:TrbC/VirB2 family protein [Alphaproteobacteria bacterium]